MYKDRHARVERKCEYCGYLFMARVERVNKGQGRFCSIKCANLKQAQDGQETWGFENGKKYWDGSKWIVQWRDDDGVHNTSYPKWWWIMNNGDVPKGFVVSYKDKDSSNIDSSNFHLLPKGRIWVENGKGNKARTGLKWDEDHRLQIGNRVRKDWANGKYESTHTGENHHNWKGGKSLEEYPPEFYKIRNFVLERDRYKCQVCGKDLTNPKFAHVHHRDANKNHNDQDNLLSLCIYCHGKVHAKGDTSPIIYSLRSELS